MHFQCYILLFAIPLTSCELDADDTVIIEAMDDPQIRDLIHENIGIGSSVSKQKKGKDLYIVPISFPTYYMLPPLMQPLPVYLVAKQVDQNTANGINKTESNAQEVELSTVDFRQGPNNPPCFVKYPGGMGRCVSRHICMSPPGINLSALINLCSYVGTSGETERDGICCSNENIAGPLYPEANIPTVSPISAPGTETAEVLGIPQLSPKVSVPTPEPEAKPILFPTDINEEYVGINGPNCGTRLLESEKIVGGQVVAIGESPWMALLLRGKKHYCGGSLIDSIHVITAAHCIIRYNASTLRELTVRLGEHNVIDDSETVVQERKVIKIARHKKFNPKTLTYDIALLTLDSPVKFGPTVRAVCLDEGTDKYVDKNATVTGWGQLNENGPLPQSLVKVDVNIWRNSQCESSYGTKAPGGILSHMMCANGSEKDSCTGDSGGPLVMNKDGYKFEQIGVVSWGIGCGLGKYPGVYTRINYFINWIKKNLDGRYQNNVAR